MNSLIKTEFSNKESDGMKAQKQTSRWLIVIMVFLLLGALKVMRPVAMPVIFALFLVVLAWPLQMRLMKHMPRSLAIGITFFIFLGILAFFMAALVLSINLIVIKAPEYANQIEVSIQTVNRWAESKGVSLFPENYIDTAALENVIGFVGKGVGEIYSLFTFIGLVMLVLLFGLNEVVSFRKKLEQNFCDDISQSINDSFNNIAEQFQRYLVTKTVVSAITGLSTGMFTWLLGLDFAFIWGLVAFLLNYIPSIGSIVSVILISLFGFIQFQNSAIIILLFAGITAIQLFLGNWVDPRMQGRYLSLSPLVVVLSVIFWGWLWGVPGALLGVPLTIGLVNALQQFERTRAISNMLANLPRDYS
jgi:predicted PurR-regulated permease PerM